MEDSRYGKLLEEGACDALEMVINPFVRGKLTSDKIDQKKLTASLQLVSNHQRYRASVEHRAGLNLIAINMVAGDDKNAMKAMVTKHYDTTMKLPAPAK